MGVRYVETKPGTIALIETADGVERPAVYFSPGAAGQADSAVARAYAEWRAAGNTPETAGAP